MPTLYSYRMRVDYGLAPNPFGQVCTLNLCKPKIRAKAKVGDWVVGTGCARMGLADSVIYAMEISQVMRMEEYDAFCKDNLPIKTPRKFGKSVIEIVGDNNYDFNAKSAARGLMHDQNDLEHDLSGKNTLLSYHFYYFGDKAIRLPVHLRGLINLRGHKSEANNHLFHPFLDWILDQKYARNKVYSKPYDSVIFSNENLTRKRCYPEKASESQIRSLKMCIIPEKC